MNMLTGRHPCLAQLLTHDHCLHVEQAYTCLEVTHLVRAQLREGGGGDIVSFAGLEQYERPRSLLGGVGRVIFQLFCFCVSLLFN
jgi:hypothetical protein